MADPNLKSIPTKTLKKVVREVNLNTLISSNEGQTYFESYLIDRPEWQKYWVFYSSVNEIFSKSENQEYQLDSIKECFQKHIAIEADPQDKVDRCVKNKAAIEELSKAISEGDIENLQKRFKEIQGLAFQNLQQEVFVGQLIHHLSEEYSSRKKNPCYLI